MRGGNVMAKWEQVKAESETRAWDFQALRTVTIRGKTFLPTFTEHWDA